MTCPFCHPDPALVFHEAPLVLGVWDAFPASEGHALLVSRRHLADWFAATTDEQVALVESIEAARTAILEMHSPAGFNIGINVGDAAGQTIPHLHIHLIPRYPGDVPDPRGGVRGVIPDKRNYLAAPLGAGPSATTLRLPVSHSDDEPAPILVRGDETDPLIAHLRRDLVDATQVDLAVAFVMRSGLALIEEYLRDTLQRGKAVRILTGDYGDVTDPTALLKLLDLEGDIQVRVFETRNRSFHPKAYLLSHGNLGGVAYVGSSNLSRTALERGVEWNYRVAAEIEPLGFREIQAAFESLFQHPDTRPVDHSWVAAYEARRRPQAEKADVEIEGPPEIPVPHAVQDEALRALEGTRSAGNTAGLVVLATGLGKTWLSAFDSAQPEFQRVLFVAHRDEILSQALATYRRIRPAARFGRYTGTEKIPDADVLFASVQTLHQAHHLEQFDRDAFDYVVIDEFHHAQARTYRRILDYFTPKFLLGLTATPERTDGGDLLALCQENLVYRSDLPAGIRRGLLSPFRYFGVPDEVNYSNIPWRSTRFDEAELTAALATQRRAQNALDQFHLRGGERALGFCCSIRHADFMAQYFADRGVGAVAVHSGAHSAPRARSLDLLRDGDLDIIFTIDLFNEGVDLPSVDTVMMLRPTESRILWLQQFGRGLRKAASKDFLVVIDYIGNHRTFLLKPQALFDLGSGDHEVREILRKYAAGELDLPPGCEVTYELGAVDVLNGLLRTPKSSQAIQWFYEEFERRHGVRPSASEAFHEGYDPRGVRGSHGSWLEFVRAMHGLDEEQESALQLHKAFLRELEATQMTRSYKMIVLLAMLNEDRFPGSIGIEELVDSVRRIARRSQHIQNDFGEALRDAAALQRHLEENPIRAWKDGKGTGGHSYFHYDGAEFSFADPTSGSHRRALQDLARELCDWRLAQYLMRAERTDAPTHFLGRVREVGGRAVVELPSREEVSGIPWGEISVSIGDRRYQAHVGKRQLDRLQLPGSERNVLPEVLRGWFGPDAGRPGTRHAVFLERRDDGWEMGAETQKSARKAEIGHTYSREEIAPLFGVPYKPNVWRQGFVHQGDLFLLVTLEKKGMAAEHQYADKFLDRATFQWESQNRQARHLPSGQLLRDAGRLGKPVHLFVRATAKLGQRAAPFYYCGQLQFDSWEGDKPIRVIWKLRTPLSDHLANRMGVG